MPAAVNPLSNSLPSRLCAILRFATEPSASDSPLAAKRGGRSMKKMLIRCAAVLVLLATATQGYSDVARRPSPTPAEGKVVFHTGLTVQPDATAYDARLQISQETLARIQQ